MAVVLVIGAGLMMRSFGELQGVDPGFDPEGLLTFRLYLPEAEYADGRAQIAFFNELVDRLGSVPGVVAATAMSGLPPRRRFNANDTEFEGIEPTEDGPPQNVDFYQWVTDGYFEALGVELKEGRYLNQRDDERGIPVVLINATMARQYWPDGSALGARFKMSSNIDTVYRTVVGLVDDVRHNSLDAEARPQMYLPPAQFPATANFPVGALTLVTRTSGEPFSIASGVRRVVSDIDRNVPLGS